MGDPSTADEATETSHRYSIFHVGRAKDGTFMYIKAISIGVPGPHP